MDTITQSKQNGLAVSLAGGGAILLWSGTAIANKIAVAYMDPMTAGVLRSMLAGIVSRPFSRSVAQGAATQCYLATAPQLDGVSGHYFADCNPARMSAHGQNPEMARRLWDVSEELAAAYL